VLLEVVEDEPADLEIVEDAAAPLPMNDDDFAIPLNPMVEDDVPVLEVDEGDTFDMPEGGKLSDWLSQLDLPSTGDTDKD
jgi:hypothetical protein